MRQWGHILPEYTIESYTRFLSTHYRRGGAPTMFVALRGGKAAGTAALDDEDMATHPELKPWLASVYTDEKYRGQGLGKMLVQRVIQEARQAGEKKLYLYTHDRQRFYERYGWKTLFEEEYHGEIQSVMALDISPHIPSR